MFVIRERCWNSPSPPNPDILITFTIQRTSTLPIFIAQALSDEVMTGIYSFLSREIVQKRGVGRDLVPIPALEGHWDKKKPLDGASSGLSLPTGTRAMYLVAFLQLAPWGRSGQEQQSRAAPCVGCREWAHFG